MKVIITGASGMVGKSVLLECLDHAQISTVLAVSRKSIGIKHPKLQELLLTDFSEVAMYKSHFEEYDACYYCMGVSVVGLDENQYTKLTYDYAKAFADTMHKANKHMVFNYVSGTGTDSSEKGSKMWARVKGKTENYILNKGFKDAYMFRPGAIIPEKGIKSKTGWYNALYVILKPLFPLLKRSKNVCTTTSLGQAMINSSIRPNALKHLENKAINRLSK